MRRLASGMPPMLMAALLLLSRGIAPSMAIPLPDPLGQLTLLSICHGEAPAPPASPADPDHSDCLLCPVCHLAAQAALPTPPAPVVPSPSVVAVGLGAPLPPATGPPNRIRATAQPTGPPTVSA